MKRIVEINASKNRKNIRLDYRNSDLKSGEEKEQWEHAHRSDNHAKSNDEPRDNLHGHVPRGHICCKTNREADRTGQIGKEFNDKEQRSHEYWCALWQEEVQELAEAVLGDCN